MATDEQDKKRRILAKRGHLSGIFKPKSELAPEHEAITSKEKKRVKRVVKAKPMAIQDESKSLRAPATAKESTALAMGSVAPVLKEPEPAEDSERLEYVNDHSSDEPEADISKDKIHHMHFDPDSGMINFMENDMKAPSFEAECSNCGTLTDFDAGKCPICGTEFKVADTGIVSLFADMEFYEDCSGEIDCPLCGEKVLLDRGKCPSCGEIVHKDGPGDSDIKVEPVIHKENVVFVHLDVESGEVNYLQRLARRLGFEQLTVKLDEMGRGRLELETDKKHLSRT